MLAIFLYKQWASDDRLFAEDRRTPTSVFRTSTSLPISTRSKQKLRVNRQTVVDDLPRGGLLCVAAVRSMKSERHDGSSLSWLLYVISDSIEYRREVTSKGLIPSSNTTNLFTQVRTLGPTD